MKSIKSITINNAFVNQDGETEYEFLSSLTRMDQNGKVLEEINWSDQDTLESKSSFVYDDEGHLLEEAAFLNEEDVSDQKKYIYDSDGRISRIEVQYGDGSLSKQVFEYKGGKTLMTITDENGEFEGSEERIFNENGNIVEYTRKGPENETESQYLYQYDENQNLTASVELDRDGDIRVKRIYEYDEKNRRISDTGYNLAGEVIYSRTYLYNDADQIEEETVDEYTIVFEYDDSGRDSRHLTYKNDDLESIKLFRYNEDGLLAEEISVQSGERYTIVPHLLSEENTNFLSRKYSYEFYSSD